MELRHFRYFIAVAEELNFTRAAERLHTSQPSLSQQIRQLEVIVGTPLFYRDKHRVQLTEAGRLLLNEARAVLRSTERAISVTRHAARRIVIGVVPGPVEVLFRSIAPILLKQCGDIELIVRDMSSPNQILALQNRELNIGFLHGPIHDDEIASEVVLRSEVVAVLPARHPLAQRERVPAKLLAEVPLIQFARNFAPAVHDSMDEIARRAGVAFHTLFETDSLLTLLNAVASGLGFSILARYLEPVLPQKVVPIPLDMDSVPELEVLTAYRKDDTLPALGVLLDLIRQSTTSFAGKR